MHRTPVYPDKLNYQKYAILIIDDSPANVGVLVEYLEKCGFELSVARDGESGIRRAESGQPDLILLDVMMPGIDGFETCRRLKANEATQDIPVIFITALTNTAQKLKGFELGGVDYITKPIHYEEVFARVVTHLRIQELQRQLASQNAVLQEKNVRLEQEIAERKRMATQMHVLNQQLQEANASKDKLFSIIAHDLRNPFNVLLGRAELAINFIDTYSKEKIRESLLSIYNTAEAVYTLLENLLTWSRVQRGLIEYQPEIISINELAEHNVYLFKSGAEEKQIRLNNRIQDLITAYADRNMVDTVLRNLISNALKFTSPGGSVDVFARHADPYLEIAVSDTGIGIPPETLPRLLRINAQCTQIGTAGEKGTGLGLSLCKELVEKNGGKLSVESEVGKGATFRFTLPQATI